MAKKEYRSAQRSRERIRAAFLALLEEKEFEKITVTDIVTRADINRSTFYAHYPDVRGLMDEAADEFLSFSMDALEQTTIADLFADPLPILHRIGEMLSGYHRMNLQLWNTEYARQLLQRLKIQLTEFLLQREDVPDSLRSSPASNIRIAFFVGGIINVYEQWLRGQLPCTMDNALEEIASMIQKLVPDGFQEEC